MYDIDYDIITHTFISLIVYLSPLLYLFIPLPYIDLPSILDVDKKTQQ